MALAAASTRRLSEGLRAVVTILYASAGTFIMRLTTVSMGGVASKLWYRVQIRRSWWGGPPGPGGTPSSRNRYNDISILQGASRPTGASAADQGVRPTINTDVVTGKSMWHWARLPAPPDRLGDVRQSVPILPMYPGRVDDSHDIGWVEGLGQQIECALVEEFHPKAIACQAGRHNHTGVRGQELACPQDFPPGVRIRVIIAKYDGNPVGAQDGECGGECRA